MIQGGSLPSTRLTYHVVDPKESEEQRVVRVPVHDPWSRHGGEQFLELIDLFPKRPGEDQALRSTLGSTA